MAKSFAWLRANNHAHDQLFLDISWWRVTSPTSHQPFTAQLQQVCGQLHYNGLKYGVLYTDECFWFLRYDADSALGTLYVSEGIMVSGTRPTVLLMLLFVGDLAQQHAANSLPSITRRQSLPLMLPLLGGFHSLIIQESSPESLPQQLRMGPLLGQGSTGSVRLSCTGNVDLAVKLFEEGVDASSACQRLQHELDLYQGLLHPLQGISVPRQMATDGEKLKAPLVQDYHSLLWNCYLSA